MIVQTEFSIGDRVIINEEHNKDRYAFPCIYVITEVTAKVSSLDDINTEVNALENYKLHPLMDNGMVHEESGANLLLATERNVTMAFKRVIGRVAEELEDKCIKEDE